MRTGHHCRKLRQEDGDLLLPHGRGEDPFMSTWEMLPRDSHNCQERFIGENELWISQICIIPMNPIQLETMPYSKREIVMCMGIFTYHNDSAVV